MIYDALGKLAARGAGFLAIQTFIKKFLGIVRTVILARLLSPEDFGLMALAMVLIMGMNSLTSVGIDKYLIQKEELDEDIIGNAWFLNVLRGLLLSVLALAICPLYASLLEEPNTLRVLWIVSFVPFVEGLRNPGAILAEREIRFGRISTYESICSVLEVTLVVTIAWFVRDAVALAWGLLFGHFLKSLLSYFFFKVPNLTKIRWSRQREMLSVAKHFAVISIGTLIMVQGDNFIVGALRGTQELGLYVIAYQLAVFPVAFLQQIANRVALPVFSNLQMDRSRLQSAVGQIMQIQLAMIIPFVITVGVFAQDLIITLYGEKWASSAPVLQALMLVTLGKGLTHVCVPYIIGTGAFGFASRMKFVETLFFLAGVYAGTHFFGLIGAAIGAGAGYMVAAMGRLFYVFRRNNLPFARLSVYSFYPALAVIPGVLMAGYLSKFIFWHRNMKTGAILLIAFIGYAGCSFLVQRNLVDVFYRKVLSK